MNSFILTILILLFSKTYATYELTDDYSPDKFASMFDFITYDDPSHGYVNYVDQNTAKRLGLFKQVSNKIYMSADHKNIASGRGRNSIRINSKKKYTHGLFILDMDHMPDNECGSWPAFWTVGSNCPQNGEIDIIEGINLQTGNAMTLHTDPGCSIIDTRDFTGHVTSFDCEVHGSRSNGCSIKSNLTETYGTGFNAVGGGVYATEWTSDFIRIWFFPRPHIPSDITSGNPDPDTWHLPLAKFSGCDIDKYFHNHSIIFDITFCGEWAGSAWSRDIKCSAKASSCVEYVKNSPTAFKNTYWLINSLKVYRYHDHSSYKHSKANSLTNSKHNDGKFVSTKDNNYFTDCDSEDLH